MRQSSSDSQKCPPPHPSTTQHPGNHCFADCTGTGGNWGHGKAVAGGGPCSANCGFNIHLRSGLPHSTRVSSGCEVDFVNSQNLEPSQHGFRTLLGGNQVDRTPGLWDRSGCIQPLLRYQGIVDITSGLWVYPITSAIQVGISPLSMNHSVFGRPFRSVSQKWVPFPSRPWASRRTAPATSSTPSAAACTRELAVAVCWWGTRGTPG